MTDRAYVLGIDTSNYTTSAAIVDTDGNIVANLKEPLPVKSGECGLRQSEAVFAHIKNLPVVMARAREYLEGAKLVAIGVSDKPRNQSGSYMPCFLAGVAAAESIAATSKLPLYRFSHQCGHIMAALHSSGADLDSSEFAAFHVSGGTTELVRVSCEENGFIAEIVGGSRDLNAGQAIDRVGVMMGLPFPAGVHLERLALENTKKIPRKRPPVNGTEVSLSGLQNLAERLFMQTGDKPLVSAFVLDYVAAALGRMRDGYIEKFGQTSFVFAGGVMSNSIIQNALRASNSYFAEPEFSRDNAVGIALLAKKAYLSEKK